MEENLTAQLNNQTLPQDSDLTAEDENTQTQSGERFEDGQADASAADEEERIPEDIPAQENPDDIRSELARTLGVQEEDWNGIRDAVMRMNREKEELHTALETVRNAGLHSQALRVYEDWQAQERELRELYPDFSLKEAAGEAAFAALLGQGLTVRQSYEALHPERMKERLEKTAKSRTVYAVRPMEAAGSVPRAPLQVKTGLSGLNRRQREEVARRVLKGERIEG